MVQQVHMKRLPTLQVSATDMYLSRLSLSILTAFFQVNLFIKAKDGGMS